MRTPSDTEDGKYANRQRNDGNREASHRTSSRVRRWGNDRDHTAAANDRRFQFARLPPLACISLFVGFGRCGVGA